MLVRLSFAVLILMASPTVLLGQVLVPDRPSGQGFFVPGPAPQTPPIPQMFTPLRAVPEHNPPPVGPSYHPFYRPRMSGVFGFVDPAAAWGGNHDREYYLLGRGDGLFLMEATPPILGNPVPTWQDLAATANDLRADFIPHNRQPIPASGNVSPPYPTPPFTAAFPHPGATVGGLTTAYTGWSECAVLRDPSGNFWAYGSSGTPAAMANPSLFVVRLQRTGPNAGLRFDASSAAWVAVQIPISGTMFTVRNITAVQDSGLLFACTNNVPGEMVVMTVNPPGSYANPACLYTYYYNLGSGPHDVVVKDRKVYVSQWLGMGSPVMGGLTLGFVDEFAIANFIVGSPPPAYSKRYWAGRALFSRNPTTGLDNPEGLAGVHSVYPSGSTLWMVGEQWVYQKHWLEPGPSGPTALSASKGCANIQPSDLNKDMTTGGYPAPNTTQYQPQLSTGRPTLTNDVPRFAWENMQAGLGGLITLPTQGGSPDPWNNYLEWGGYTMNRELEMHSIVHHIRGIHQTGFFAHYCDGIDLVDLSDPALGPQIMGSFDTADENMMTRWWTVLPANRDTCNAADVSKGAYDLWPHHDSGLICVANGAEGAILFRVDQGHFNRYWHATPFGSGATSPGVIPRIVAENGPPRFGRQFIVRNGNRASFATPGSTIYRYTLVANYSPPTSAPASPGPNGYFVNVSPLPPNGAVYGPQVGSDMFVIPASHVPLEGAKVFMQMIVEEGLAPLPDSDADFIPLNPPRFSASRGTWIGVCKQ